MKTRKLLIAIAILAILLSGFSSPSKVSADWSKVDQRVLDQIDANGTAKFHVVMAFQADVSGAASLSTKVEKTTYVYNLLTRTAAQTQAPLLAQMRAEGVTYRSYYIYNMIEVTSGRAMLEWLTSRPEVARIVPLPDPQKEPVYHDMFGGAFGPDLPSAAKMGPDQGGEGVEWNITRVGAPDVWAMGFHGEGMVVGDNDTGVEYNHPALVNHYRGNLGSGNFDHNYNWWGGAGSTVPTDGDGHGTHTMGTMIGDDGGANQIGMAPGAQWIACAGLGGADTVECFEWFLAPWDLNHQNPDPSQAPDAINNSWYDQSGYNYRPIIQNLNAAGVAVIKSAGNWGPGCSTISPPGNVPEIIATAAFGQGDVIADFSSRGPDSTYGQTILKPEVAAPGVNVRSSVPGGGYEGGWSGTSMAAPHSTGLVALIWSAAPCIQGDVPLTKQIMMETAEAKIDAQCGPFVDHPNDVWGWGILDAQAAVNYAVGYCGGLGGLEGTVTDSSTNLPIEGAEVLASGASGFNKTDSTDNLGFYAMSVLSDTYTVSASKYGYQTAEIPGVAVTTDVTTTQDLSLTPLPVYTVSGHLYDTVSGDGLEGTVEFTDAPLPPVSTDPAGFYSIEVAQGTWHLLAKAAAHLSQTQEVVVDGNLTVDFYLDPLPCILLVDDDQNGPDVQSYYTEALNDLGYGYNVWDVSVDGDPSSDSLIGYRHVLWFTGYPYSGTFSGSNETAVGTYLDTGGNFFMSSQDYLYDAGLTAFGQNYLHIASFTSDVSQTSVTGQNVYSGLGPYSLTYPFTNYSDTVNPDAQAQVAFTGNVGNAAVSFDGASFDSVFLGYPFEAIPQLADRSAVMGRTIDFFGGCEPPADVSIEPPTQEQIGEPGITVTYAYTVTNEANEAQDVLLSVEAIWPTDAPTSTGELAPGASTTVTVTVTIPEMPAVIIGSDVFTLTATGTVGGDDTATGTTYANVNPAVDVTAPADGNGKPLDLVSYEFTVTNSGDYTDSFTLDASGVWVATLPGGNNTGLLAAGASTTVIVQVLVPEGAAQGDFDVTTLTVTSDLDPAVTASASVTTTAMIHFFNLLPLIQR